MNKETLEAIKYFGLDENDLDSDELQEIVDDAIHDMFEEQASRECNKGLKNQMDWLLGRKKF